MSGGRLSIWPSIDLMGGRVVRLLRGERERTTVFTTDPIEVARIFESEGADGLHVVDLDAAFGKGENRLVIGRILDAVSFPVQVGGGIGDRQSASFLFERGVRRVVVGSLPFSDAPLFLSLLREMSPSRFVVALDCRDSRPTVRGWTEDAGAGNAASVARDLARIGVSALLVTDVARDGAMAGPNLDLLASVRAAFGGEILASGGMRGEEDLLAADRALSGAERGAIFGRALHAGATSVARLVARRDALEAAAIPGAPR